MRKRIELLKLRKQCGYCTHNKIWKNMATKREYCSKCNRDNMGMKSMVDKHKRPMRVPMNKEEFKGWN